jgi:hypothetical protein
MQRSDAMATMASLGVETRVAVLLGFLASQIMKFLAKAHQWGATQAQVCQCSQADSSVRPLQ